jgi:hydroxymethylglutaryl-CoA reductase
MVRGLLPRASLRGVRRGASTLTKGPMMIDKLSTSLPHRPGARPGPPGPSTTTSGGSAIPGFHRLPLGERRALLAEAVGLSDEELRAISGDEGLAGDQADHMVENALGVISVPLALCLNLRVDGRDRLLPMAVEEASVVAAASHAAKLLRSGGGVRTDVAPARMIGQIQVLDVPNPAAAERALREARAELLRSADTLDPCLLRAGGGAMELVVRHLPPLADDPVGPMLVVHLVVDVRDAMGANTVNSMCEHLAPRIEELTGGRVVLRIISNLADRRTVVATGAVPLPALEGKGCGSARELAERIVAASVFAERDPYRAATHNKGIMNGVDAVLVAFGQDWRAVEAGAHAYAARGGRYTALAIWRLRHEQLIGRLELPLPVGVVGGVTAVHPTYRVARRIAQIGSAAELASVTAAVGLAQNLGALRALAAEGIQRGHMRVHARNVAVAAGASGHEVDLVARTIADARSVTAAAAGHALRALHAGGPRRTATELRARLEELRRTYLPRISALIECQLAEASGVGSSLATMCRYHLSTGGKKLRALLPLLVADSLGADPAPLIPFGAACEMLHNATLVHDDVQDGDRLRRGQPTIWQRFGVAQAINLGDAMFYYTLLLIQRLDAPAVRREALARQALLDTLRVIHGQDRELLLNRVEQPSRADYFEMVEAKTSGLFVLPLAGAARLCAAPAPVVAALREAGRQLGILFQIQDDLLDLYGEKGRDERGSDIREGKRSFLVVNVLQSAAPEEASWLRRVLDQPRDATSAADVVAAVTLFERTGALQLALREISERRELALRSVAALDHQQLQALVEAMCDLFLDPIRPLITRFSAQA